MKPSFEARMVYQVGSPAMLDGNRFFPETGTPIWKMARSSTMFDDCDPDPFAVATWIEKSFTTGPRAADREAPWVVEVWFSAMSAPARGRALPAPRGENNGGARRRT